MSSDKKRRFTVSETGVNFKCPNCAGQLRYDIGKKEMLCGQCGSSFPVNRIPDSTGSGKKQVTEIETIEYHCPSCGASLHTTASGMTSYCVFCGSDTVLEERMTRMRRPDRIVPFTVTREDCERIYRERLRNTPLVPGTMKKAETISRFRPVYVPFWSLGGKGEGHVTGEYSTVELTDTEIRTNVYEAEIKAKVSVSGILYDACSQFDDETAQWLELSSKKALTFHPAYLSGFYAEAPDVESGLFSGLTRNYAVQSAAGALEAAGSRSGASMTLPENFTESAELVLMPVWLLASRQGEKMIYTAIRGSDKAENEKIHCELPVSPKRFILMLCVLAALFTALILRLHRLIILRPQITVAISGVLAVLCWNAAAPFLARVHRRGKDSDPTRRMLKDSGPLIKRNLYDYIPSDEQQGEGSSRYTLHGKKLLMTIAVIAGFLLLYVIMNRNPLRAINSLVSDDSVFPPMLSAASAVLLIVILFKNRDLSGWNKVCLAAQAGICMLSVFCGKQKELLYVFGLTGIVLTLLVMLNAFRRHNEYVTRPVPFFGEEGQNE